jgi:hypothetical protein
MKRRAISVMEIPSSASDLISSSRRQRIKLFSELTPEQRLCIHSLTYTEKGKPNLKLYDKQDASKALRQLLGLDAPTKIAPTNAKGDGPAQMEFLDVSDADRVKALEAFVLQHLGKGGTNG